VLLSVFVPTAFLPGITGQLFRQFAVTITVAMLISALNALTLSPSLSAVFLRPGATAAPPVTMPMTGPVISPMALMVASLGGRPCSMW